MTELDDFLRAYDAWLDSDELCAGPLFDRMLEARVDLDAMTEEWLVLEPRVGCERTP